MRSIVFTVFSLLFLPIQAQETAEIRGNVVDENNHPIPFTTIYIEALRKGATADEAGNYILTNIPYGTWEVTASNVGHSPISKSITVDQPRITAINFQLAFNNTLESVEIFGNRN